MSLPQGPKGYTKFPLIFLEAGECLKLSIFLNLPLNDKVVLFKKKGSVLSIDECIELQKKLPSVIARDSEVKEALLSFSVANARPVSALLARFGKGPAEISRQLLTESSEIVGSVVQQFQNRIRGTSTLRKFLDRLLRSKGDLAEHNRNVSSVATLLLMGLGNATSEEVEEIAFAGLVHDSCLDQVPELYRNRHLTGDELMASSVDQIQKDHIRHHIELVTSLLESEGFEIPSGTKKIVLQHHENFDGSGYLGLEGAKTLFSARVLRVADDIVPLLQGRHGYSLEQALQQLQWSCERQNIQAYDPELLERARELLLGTV